MQKSLKDFAVGQSGKVVKVVSESKIRRRLYDMGVTHGVEIKLTKVAPMGDPLNVELRGYQLSLRKAEAENVVMEVAE
ncbi:MAG: ferrous iron transport protein A [Clostridia bacterium]|nr:ferrous iron transport protein A [Clostridia bacterium]